MSASDDLSATFTAPGLLDEMKVSAKIFQVAPGDNRFAHQVTVSYLDDKQQQYDLLLLDQMTGEVLLQTSLVNEFTGRVFTASPGFPAHRRLVRRQPGRLGPGLGRLGPQDAR